jgi:Skp family chaperone for outer membrane proteins
MAGSEPILAEGGKDIDWLKARIDDLHKVGKLKALISWLREAISEKESAGKLLKQTSLEMWLRNQNIPVMEVPEMEDVDMSDMEKPLRIKPILRTFTEDDIMAKWSVGERQHYLSLEAEVSNIGKIVHLKGPFNKARKEMHSLSGKTEVLGEGQASLTVKTYVPSADIKEVDKIFLSLQEEHRRLQAELNGIKHDISVKLTKLNADALAEFRKEDAEVNETYKAKNAEYEAVYKQRSMENLKKYNDEKSEYDKWYNSVSAQHNSWMLNESQRISDLKILIPNNLLEIYNLVKDS